MRKNSSAAYLRSFWKRDGKCHPKSEKELRLWLEENNLPSGAGDITVFLHDPQHQKARLSAKHALVTKTGKG